MRSAFDGHLPRVGNCLNCSLPFTYQLCRARTQKFCKPSCYFAYRKARMMPPVPCVDCGAGVKRKLRRERCDKCRKNAPKTPCFMAKCEVCGTETKRNGFRKGLTRFCSYKCKYEADRRYLTIYCALCGKPRTGAPGVVKNLQYCSPICVAKSRRETEPERHVREALGRLAIPFIPQHRVGRYTIDFFLPLLNVAVEVDGAYWHSPEKDAKKDRALSRVNIQVIRLPFSSSDKFLRSDVYGHLRKRLKT